MSVLSAENQKGYARLFDEIWGDDVAPQKLCMDILYVFNVWDDLIDKDVERTPEEISGAFLRLMDDIPENPVMLRAGDILRPILYSCYTQWLAANYFETVTKTDEDIEKAYMLRAAVYQFFVMVVKVTLGKEAAERLSPHIFAAYSETATSLKEEISNA